MRTQGDRAEEAPLVRTSVLVPEETLATLRRLADAGRRPLSWEIRQALKAHAEAKSEEPAAA